MPAAASSRTGSIACRIACLPSARTDQSASRSITLEHDQTTASRPGTLLGSTSHGAAVCFFRAAELELSRPECADPSFNDPGRAGEVMLYQVNSPLVAVRVQPRPDQLTILTIPSGVTIRVGEDADEAGLIRTIVDGELLAVFVRDLDEHTAKIAAAD